MRSAARTLAAVLVLARMAQPGSAGQTTFTMEERLRVGVPPVYLDIRSTSTFPIELGGGVTFANEGLLQHTLEDEHGLFRWGPIAPGERLDFVPWAAGTYTIRDADRLPGEPEQESFGVPAPHPAGRILHGSVCPAGTEMTIEYPLTWATEPAPHGFVYDVQVFGSDDDAWRWLVHGTRHPHTRLALTTVSEGAPHHMHLRARLRHEDDETRATGWSPQTLHLHVGSPCPSDASSRQQG